MAGILITHGSFWLKDARQTPAVFLGQDRSGIEPPLCALCVRNQRIAYALRHFPRRV